jgi:hypothetical protein
MKHKTSAKIFAEHARGEHNHFRTLKRKGKLYIPVEDRPINSVPGSFNIQAPEKISIYEHTEDNDSYSSTMEFVRNITEYFGKTKCALNFTNTTKISSAALVVIYAAVDTARLAGRVKSTIVSTPT